MKKILMLASEASHFRNFHIPYIKYLQHKGDKVFTASNGSFDMDGVSHFYMPFKKKLVSFGNIKVIFKLAGLMRKGKFDIVYTNSTLAGFMGRMAVILSRQRYTKAYHICHGYLFNDDGGKKDGNKFYTLYGLSKNKIPLTSCAHIVILFKISSRKSRHSQCIKLI